MQPSRRELLDDFLDFVGEASDANARNTAERLLNRAIHTLWMKHPWRQFQMPMPLVFPTVANQRAYALPAHFGRVEGGKVRSLTRRIDLLPFEVTDLQTMYGEAGTPHEIAAPPQIYSISGTSGVSTLVLVPEVVSVSSSSDADGATVWVTVEGPDVTGRWVRQQVLLVGTVPVAFPIPVVPWVFSKATVAGTLPTPELSSSVGTVTLSGAVSGVLQTLLPTESALEFQVLTLYPKPSVPDDLIAVPYLRAPGRATSDSDPIPNNWEEAVFEEMTIQWRINTGEMSLDTTNVVRPKFLDLLAFEQANRFGHRPATRPFRG